jgi:hypothetical protein
LSQYDASSLTSEEASEIIAAFEEAGIQPSRALGEAMKAEGFDAKEVGDLAGVGGPKEGHMPPPPPPPPSEEEQSEISTLLNSILNEESSDEDNSTTTSSFDEIMEYTSKILNLNDESKEEVMNILNEYSENENNYSQEELTTIIKSSLSTILTNKNNYNTISLYA